MYYSTAAPSFSHPFYDITTNKGMYVRVRGEKLVQQLHAVVLLLTPPIWKLWANRIGGLVVGWLAEWPFSSLSCDTAVLKFMSLGNGIEHHSGQTASNIFFENEIDFWGTYGPVVVAYSFVPEDSDYLLSSMHFAVVLPFLTFSLYLCCM